MAQHTSIPGSVGTLPQGAPPDERIERRVPSAAGKARPSIGGRPGTTPQAEPADAPRIRTVLGPRRGAELADAITVAARHRRHLTRIPHVLDVRAGYKFKDGRITDTPAVVVVVDRKLKDLPRNAVIPFVVDGIVTDVAPADPFERLQSSAAGDEITAAVRQQRRLLIDELQGRVIEAVEELAPAIAYEPPAGGDLSKVTGPMTVTCHVSPDAGWAVLQPFLSAARQQICLGMYDFTAPHIYRAARTLLKNEEVSWRQTIGPKASLPGDNDVDSTKADDLTEEKVNTGLRRLAGDRFETAFAQIGSGRTFASAYHIKVAVRDKRAFWLSSGNWQSSNQPDIDFLDQDADVSLMARFNREWHIVVDSAPLAKTFQLYLEHDFDTAKAPLDEAAPAPLAGPDLLIPVEEFLRAEEAARNIEVFPPRKFVFTADRPLTVQPILTPDNYADIVLALMRKRPVKRLYFQNQSLNPIMDPNPEFAQLMDLLAD